MQKNIEFSRLRKVLLSDKIASPKRLNEVIRQDILKVLSSYMEIDIRDLNVQIETNLSGFDISIAGYAKRLKSLPNCIEN